MAQDSPFSWHVLGAGSMGCLWAALLARSGVPATLLIRDARITEQYSGIRLTALNGAQSQLPVPLLTVSAARGITHLMVCTKAFDTLEAVESVAQALAPGCPIVLLQNGMGQQEQLSTRFADHPLYCALSTEGAWLQGPFDVVHAGEGQTLIGRYPAASIDDQLDTIIHSLSSAARCLGSDRIVERLWEKLAVNCAINPLTALHGCCNGELLSDPILNGRFEALCDELKMLFDRLGFSTVAQTLHERARTVARDTAQNRSSMLQDLHAGRRTEIDYINGFLCAQAAQAGLSHPLNASLVASIRARGG